MIRKIQISVMALATILLLAHQFVPHHHHDKGVETCKDDSEHQHNQKPEVPLEKVYAMHQCLCDHDHEGQHTNCKLAFETIEKQTYSNGLIAVVSVLYFFDTPNVLKQAFYQKNESLIRSCFYSTPKLRGPPAIV